MDSGIYAIRHRDSPRCYVGSAKNIARRFVSHLSELRRNRHHSQKLQNAWNKYGEAAFELAVLERCGVPDLIVREQSWMDSLQSFTRGFNARPRAESRLGAKASPELRKRLSAAHAGKPLSDSHREALTAALRAPDVRAKISSTLKGRPLSAETRAKMSFARTGKMYPNRAKRPADLVARLAVAMRGNQYGKGYKLTPEQLSKRAARRGVPWSASRRAAYEASRRGSASAAD